MSDPITVVGFYFALIGFLSGIFFTRLDSWYGDVRSKRAVFASIENRDTLLRWEEQFISLKSSMPLSGFLAIGGFVTALAVLSLFIPKTNSNLNPWLFLYGPVFVTVVGYWLGGGFLLKSGTRLIDESLKKINDAKIGVPISH